MKFCMECGKKLPDVAKFCSGCGAKVTAAKKKRDVESVCKGPINVASETVCSDRVPNESVLKEKGVADKFRDLCTKFFKSKNGILACKERNSFLPEVEKLPIETVAKLVKEVVPDLHEIGEQWKNFRIAVECDDCLKPVLWAKVVRMSLARFPYLYPKQKWSLFMRHEQVLLLLMDNEVSSLDMAISLSDLGKTCEEYGVKPFSAAIQWVAVGAGKIPDESDEKEFWPHLGYNTNTIRFDNNKRMIILSAQDKSVDLFFSEWK